ncbi:MAG: DUF2721 domain-containing protein [Novosphingobium sp.]
MIAQTIQLALAPVFVLVAIGNILNLLSSRLGRVVDRSRHLQNVHTATEGPEHDVVVAEIRMIDQRIRLITRAVSMLVSSGLAIGVTVALLFVQQLLAADLQLAAASTFVVAIVLLMYALLLFMRETRISAQQLKIPREYLELDRKL